tara:strand:+ start:252 stop:815 length:564 start_codon:yes stop_codon:yes gene_type:complete
MKHLLESWKSYSEQISRKEIERRRKKKLFTGYTDRDDIVPADLQALGRGIITASNDAHNEDGEFSDYKTDGSYSQDRKQGERKGNKRTGSRSPCGRRKAADGHKYKCKDGTLREDDLGRPDDIDAAYIKATVEQAVKKAVTAALQDMSRKTGGRSLSSCLRMVNAVNRSEDGKLYDQSPKKGSKKRK